MRSIFPLAAPVARVAFVVVTMTASAAVAQEPFLQLLNGSTHYELLPRHSVMVQTGGFAGVEIERQLFGDYDFDFGSLFVLRVDDEGAIYETYERTGKFKDVRITSPAGLMLPAFWDVGDFLNLEGLTGELLPLQAPFDVYRFRGIIDDSAAASPLEASRLDLYAAVLGPWMYLYGQTTPPPWSADVFEYEIKALAHRGPWLDMNQDGVVDAADYTALRDTEDDPRAFAPHWGSIYDVWSEQYGERVPDASAVFAALGSALDSAKAQAIPEPASLVFIVTGLAAVVASQRR